jgi:hypothetical protein
MQWQPASMAPSPLAKRYFMGLGKEEKGRFSGDCSNGPTPLDLNRDSGMLASCFEGHSVQ